MPPDPIDIYIYLAEEVWWNIQSSHHVSGADTVHPDIIRRPLDGKRRRQVPNSSLSSIIRRLGLRHVDHSAGHGTDHHDATGGLAFDQMTSNAGSEQVASINIDGPALLHALRRVVDGIEVLGETRGGDEVVDVAVLGNDVLDGLVDRFGAANIGVVGGDPGRTIYSSSQYAFIRVWGDKEWTHISNVGFSCRNCLARFSAWYSDSSSTLS